MYDLFETLDAIRTKHSSHLHGMPAPDFVKTYVPHELARTGGTQKLLVLNRYRLPIGVYRGLRNDTVDLKQWFNRSIAFRENPLLRNDLFSPHAPFLYRYSPGDHADFVERLEQISQLALEPLEARKAFGLVGGLRAR